MEFQKKLSKKIKDKAIKSIISSNIFDIFTRLEVLLGLKLSGPTDTPTQASNLINELHKTGEKEKIQKYQKAVDELYTNSMIATIKLTFRTNNFHEKAEKKNSIC